MTAGGASDRWQEVERLYHDAMARPAADRAVFLDQACASDASLRAEVESLLRYAAAAEGFIEEPAAAILAVGEPDESDPLSQPGLLGRHIGEFMVVSRLGSGGMGEVYRAHDSRLGRDVAIKVLPPLFARDPERLRRFQREARLLASLNHPNIAAIYGVEGDGVAPALILELVEGPTLADVIARAGSTARGLKLEQAVSIATQIAAALEAAHDKGVVHRDLKPANIKLARDGTVKVLDFGVAKALSGARDPQDTAGGVLAKASDTRHGAVVGTPGYMSPEQAGGEPVDKRTDIWAFGCVLFEMLAGRPPFAGRTAAETLAAVFDGEPDWAALPAVTPPAVRRLLARCLERSPKRRLRDIGDARLELEDADASLPAASLRGRAAAGGWLLFGAGAAIAALVGVVWPRSQPPPARVQFSITAPAGQLLLGAPWPSPDGRRLAIVARAASGQSALWVRDIGAPEWRRVPGTENVLNASWSAGGDALAFSADGVLKRVSLPGGPVQRITDLDPTLMGAAWNRDDVIVFSPANLGPLHRVSAAGTGRMPLTSLNAERRENSHRWPHFLPDGRHFLFTARSDLPQNTGIFVASLDEPDRARWLLTAQSQAKFAAGHLLFVRDNTLLAQRFDARSLELSGEPVAVAGDVPADPAGAVAQFNASADGSVLTRSTFSRNRLVWFDRTGRETPIQGPEGDFLQLQLSPDGSRAALVIPDTLSNRDVWVVRLDDGSRTRLTSHPASDWFPVWSPDGTELIFLSNRDRVPTFYRKPADGSAEERPAFTSASVAGVFPTSWSPDGRVLAFHSYPRGDISLVPLAGGPPVPIVESRFTDWVASFSPDGRWLAYVSDESGSEEVYVRPIGAAGRYRVSVNGGVHARWRRDGRELFYLGPGNELLSVAVGPGPRFAAGPPVVVPGGCKTRRRDTFSHLYDVAADGSRTLWICPGDGDASAEVAVNWSEMLSRPAD